MNPAPRVPLERLLRKDVHPDVAVAALIATVALALAGGRYDTQTLNKPVLAFVLFEKGLMGDASLRGARISKIGE